MAHTDTWTVVRLSLGPGEEFTVQVPDSPAVILVGTVEWDVAQPFVWVEGPMLTRGYRGLPGRLILAKKDTPSYVARWLLTGRDAALQNLSEGSTDRAVAAG